MQFMFTASREIKPNVARVRNWTILSIQYKKNIYMVIKNLMSILMLIYTGVCYYSVVEFSPQQNQGTKRPKKKKKNSFWVSTSFENGNFFIREFWFYGNFFIRKFLHLANYLIFRRNTFLDHLVPTKYRCNYWLSWQEEWFFLLLNKAGLTNFKSSELSTSSLCQKSLIFVINKINTIYCL